ncbi:MAG TPA: hypothetical protein DCZ10_07310 [Pelotomaculum sp.]|nr:hypothetical protein [Pelotomaculum sp.]
MTFRKRVTASILTLALLLTFCTTAPAEQGAKSKKAILLVTFGTSVQSAMHAYDNLENAVKEAFPGIEVRWSFTSEIIRDKIAARDGRSIDDPFTALSKLRAEGYDQIVVQSDHIFSGQEYSDLRALVNSFLALQTADGSLGPKKLALGKPLLYYHEDYFDAVEALASQFPADTSSNAVVLMGHGSEHPADSAYGKLNDILRHKFKNVFLGTVEGYPTLEEIQQDLKDSGATKITLMPLMNIAGDHALNDLYGDEEDSWKSQLAENGYTTEGYLKGLLENKAVVNIYVNHLSAAMAEFEADGIKEATTLVNGERLKFGEPLLSKDGSILAQLKPVFTALGFTVTWDEAEGVATANKTDLTVSFQPGSNVALVNGAEVIMDTECQLVNGSAMIPLSFLSKNLDCRVNWDADNTINIFKE